MDVTLLKKTEGRINRKNGELLKKLKVTAYARVSTDNEEQLNSFNAQKKYYAEKINENPEWTYVELYADEGISGTQDFKRTQFLKMIDDALEGKFDLILTKSISRFARNTLDTLKYVRLLKEHNVGILFEEENINTLDMTGELLLTILSSVAQQESETISSHVKLGQKMKTQRGELIGFNNCMGYRYDSKSNKMTIVEEEADIVRMIFNWYLDGYGAQMICNKLTEMNIKAFRGGSKWSDSVIYGILHNEKYVGDALVGKTFTLDPISHKRLKNFGEADKFYIKNHHQPIISREDFEQVQEMLKIKRGARACGRRLGNVGRKGIFSSRIRCGYCGYTYGRKNIPKNATTMDRSWACIQSVNSGRSMCVDSKTIKEDVVKKAFVDSFKLLVKQNNIDTRNLFNEIKNAMRDNSPIEKIKELDNKKELLEKKKTKLVDYMLDETISKEVFEKKKEELEKKLEKLNQEIESYVLLKEDDDKIENGISKIMRVIQNNSDKAINDFDEEVFDALIDYIIVGGYDETGNKDQFMIRFICKTNFKNTLFRTKEIQHIVDNNHIPNSNYLALLDFKSDQRFYYFDTTGPSREKKLIKHIRVRVELEV